MTPLLLMTFGDVIESPLFWVILIVSGIASALVSRDAFSWLFNTAVFTVLYPVIWCLLFLAVEILIPDLLLDRIGGQAVGAVVASASCLVVAVAHIRSVWGYRLGSGDPSFKSRRRMESAYSKKWRQ